MSTDPRDARIESLEAQLANLKAHASTYYASSSATKSLRSKGAVDIPEEGHSAQHVKEYILQEHELDFKPRLNTSSYVNVVSEHEEKEVSILGAGVNLADASVYPASVRLHDNVVEMMARLWHAPEPAPGQSFSGSGTVGSTEACLLAGLAHKFRWRKWYAARHGLTPKEVVGVTPNVVMSTCFQAAWEKLFKYFDIEPKLVKPSINSFTVTGSEIAALCDEKTIAVVGILGNHYNGEYDPIWDIDAALSKLNKEKGWQIGIHIDGASGGFIAPFQDDMPPFDFRLDNVLSMSSSGHKFGQSVCGTGWVVFRERADLAEHIAISVSYLGGKCDSMTLNFSRPASGPFVQLYKLVRLGKQGYRELADNQMDIARYIRAALKKMEHPSGKPRFVIMDGGDKHCLPVVGARLNPEVKTMYDDIDLQHALSLSHWYVSAYKLSFENPETHQLESLFRDAEPSDSMLRVVCKSNLTRNLADDLIQTFEETLKALDELDSEYQPVVKGGKDTHGGHGHIVC